jgi:hypothetical protein
VTEIFARCLLGAVIALCACNAPTPEPRAVPGKPPGDATRATVAQPPSETPPAPPAAAPPVSPSQTATEAIAVPPGALYVCVSGAGSQLRQTPIEYAPAVGDLCGRHPEMGPCRYERDACRRRGGRVFAAEGKEITLLTEAEYDKRVMRARLRAD